MKITNIILTLTLTVLLFACKKESTSTPTPATTGGLIVKVKLKNSTGFISGAEVGLATSQTNLDNGVYLQDKITNSNGQADFGQLNPGNYYYDALAIVGGADYYGEGQVQIVAGQNLELTLVVE